MQFSSLNLNLNLYLNVARGAIVCSCEDLYSALKYDTKMTALFNPAVEKK